tara:strand:- start:189 stop:413 length:225 start_codon:yes stop_codon:yes gene_type:complete
MSLIIIGWVLMYFVIKAYYTINNIRIPYEKWYLNYKKDVAFRERLILSLLMQVPLGIIIIFFNDLIILIENLTV